MLQSMGSQRVVHDLGNEQQQQHVMPWINLKIIMSETSLTKDFVALFHFYEVLENAN